MRQLAVCHLKLHVVEDAAAGHSAQNPERLGQRIEQHLVGLQQIGSDDGQYKVFTPALLKSSERWIELCLKSGLPREKALMAARASSFAISGLVDETIIEGDKNKPKEEILALIPVTRHLFYEEGLSPQDFELTVRALVEGLHSLLSGGDPSGWI